MPDDGTPTPKPRRPYRLSENDRRFPRSLRIRQDEDKEQSDALPYPFNPPRVPEDGEEP
jgi:hypothetical protein